MLTPRQQELLIFIHGQIKEIGYSPSYQEMQNHLGLSSKSGIYRYILSLVERGFIRRIPNKARALEVIKLPSAATISAPPRGRQEFKPSIVGSTKHESVLDRTIPVYGSIDYDSPSSLIEKETYQIKLPDGIDTNEEYFALEMNGLWMNKAGILKEDLLIFVRTSSATNGDIVCALLDNEVATIRRYRQTGKSIALETAEEDKETQIFKRKQVEILGTLMLLQRRFV